VSDFVTLHDNDGNGIPEGVGDIFLGSSTYNERDGHPKEAGDGVGAQYQATLGYSKILRAKGDTLAADAMLQRAEALKVYFETVWSVPDNPDDIYVRGYTSSHNKLTGFGKEGSWFMPMKMVTTPGERNDKYLALIADNVSGGIEGGGSAPNNIEAYTYLPDMFSAYNWNDEAWKWMEYIIDRRDDVHEHTTQGTNGNYPEISFTLVSQTVEGLLGVQPDAASNSVTTVSRLPVGVDWLEVEHIKVGDHTLGVKHNGLDETVLSHEKGIGALHWDAQFYGEYEVISVNGSNQAASHKILNGETISYVSLTLNAGDIFTVTAIDGSKYLSNMTPSSAVQGWGELGLNYSVKNTILTLAGVPYSKGLGTHANSDIRYNLNGQYSRFIAEVGVDDEADNTSASVQFQVWADGTNLLYDSGVMVHNSSTQNIDIDITGTNELKLLVLDGGNGINSDHANWANAQIIHATELLLDNGFEEGISQTAWSYTGAGRATNRPYSGAYLAYINAGTSNKISQQLVITASEAGIYDLTGWVSSDGLGGVFGIKVNGTVVASAEIPNNTVYNQQRMLDIQLNTGDNVEVYIQGGSGWLNIDDLSLKR
jgi:hypothetical protein